MSNRSVKYTGAPHDTPNLKPASRSWGALDGDVPLVDSPQDNLPKGMLDIFKRAWPTDGGKTALQERELVCRLVVLELVPAIASHFPNLDAFERFVIETRDIVKGKAPNQQPGRRDHRTLTAQQEAENEMAVAVEESWPKCPHTLKQALVAVALNQELSVQTLKRKIWDARATQKEHIYEDFSSQVERSRLHAMSAALVQQLCKYMKLWSVVMVVVTLTQQVLIISSVYKLLLSTVVLDIIYFLALSGTLLQGFGNNTQNPEYLSDSMQPPVRGIFLKSLKQQVSLLLIQLVVCTIGLFRTECTLAPQPGFERTPFNYVSLSYGIEIASCIIGLVGWGLLQHLAPGGKDLSLLHWYLDVYQRYSSDGYIRVKQMLFLNEAMSTLAHYYERNARPQHLAQWNEQLYAYMWASRDGMTKIRSILHSDGVYEKRAAVNMVGFMPFVGGSKVIDNAVVTLILKQASGVGQLSFDAFRTLRSILDNVTEQAGLQWIEIFKNHDFWQAMYEGIEGKGNRIAALDFLVSITDKYPGALKPLPKELEPAVTVMNQWLGDRKMLVRPITSAFYLLNAWDCLLPPKGQSKAATLALGIAHSLENRPNQYLLPSDKLLLETLRVQLQHEETRAWETDGHNTSTDARFTYTTRSDTRDGIETVTLITKVGEQVLYRPSGVQSPPRLDEGVSQAQQAAAAASLYCKDELLPPLEMMLLIVECSALPPYVGFLLLGATHALFGASFTANRGGVWLWAFSGAVAAAGTWLSVWANGQGWWRCFGWAIVPAYTTWASGMVFSFVVGSIIRALVSRTRLRQRARNEFDDIQIVPIWVTRLLHAGAMAMVLVAGMRGLCTLHTLPCLHACHPIGVTSALDVHSNMNWLVGDSIQAGELPALVTQLEIYRDALAASAKDTERLQVLNRMQVHVRQLPWVSSKTMARLFPPLHGLAPLVVSSFMPFDQLLHMAEGAVMEVAAYTRRELQAEQEAGAQAEEDADLPNNELLMVPTDDEPPEDPPIVRPSTQKTGSSFFAQAASTVPDCPTTYEKCQVTMFYIRVSYIRAGFGLKVIYGRVYGNVTNSGYNWKTVSDIELDSFDQLLTCMDTCLEYAVAAETLQHKVMLHVHGFNVASDNTIVDAWKTCNNVFGNRQRPVLVSFRWPTMAGSSQWLMGTTASAVLYPCDRLAIKHVPLLTTIRNWFWGSGIDRKLEGVIQGLNFTNVVVVAHSMGNQVLMNALSHMNISSHVAFVFAAPDVDSTEFSARLAALVDNADHNSDVRAALYCNRHDHALAISTTMHGRMPRPWKGRPRAGNCAPYPKLPLRLSVEAVDHTGHSGDEEYHHSGISLSNPVGQDVYHFLQAVHPCDQQRNLICMHCGESQHYVLQEGLEKPKQLHDNCSSHMPPCQQCREDISGGGKAATCPAGFALLPAVSELKR